MADKFKISIKISGLQNIIASLGNKKQALLNGLKDGVNMGSAVVEARAKEIVPVRSGNLMRSIFTEFYDGGFRALIGPDINAAPYGYYVEFGRSKSGKEPPYPFAGRHYMEGAFHQTQSKVKNILESAVKNAIRGSGGSTSFSGGGNSGKGSSSNSFSSGSAKPTRANFSKGEVVSDSERGWLWNNYGVR